MFNRLSRRDFIRLVAAGIAAGIARPESVFASEVAKKERFSPDIAATIADNFAKGMCPKKNLSIGDPIPVFNEIGKLKGYSIDLFDAGAPHGYAVFDVDYNGLVSQYALEENVVGLYKSLSESNGVAKKGFSSQRPSLVVIDPFTYGIPNEEKQTIETRDGSLKMNPECSRRVSGRSVGTSEWEDTWYPSIYEDGWLVIKETYGYEMRYVTDTQAIRGANRYACVVHALYCIASSIPNANKTGFLISLPGSHWHYYDRLWYHTKTWVNYTKNGVDYGLTYNKDAGPGFKAFCSERGLSTSYWYSQNPRFTDFDNHASQYLASVVGATINRNTDGGVKQSGHALAVSGTNIALVGGNHINLLYAFNGWKDMVYFNYDFKRFVNLEGTFLTFPL